ncbi:PKD domain-containing protein [Fulvivirga sp. M361]|uniref:nidogen-like domain-containing protein n=1 Tax=Fulvivirga sp. M361 TaxID=2594266 RepID=UPI00117B4C9A|nr:nidogen-like domain-containing protein [Fulvivirga sp. M361]TRX59119.1 PKD domain-containing protein [Fulvivirga sp. M361]
MKPTFIFTLYLALSVQWITTNAQNNPQPGTKEYDRLKAEGLIRQPAQVPRQKNYPVLLDASTKVARVQGVAASEPKTISNQSAALQQSFSCSIENPWFDPSYQVLPVNDDESSSAVPLPFTFNFFGNNYSQVYVNNNGNISFNASNATYTSTGFPSSFDMIAPFWADVDTRGVGNGRVFYKAEATRFTVIWYKVGYYNQKTDKTNTFKLVITDGTDPIIGAGNNTAFYYGDMQWTTGDASGSGNGFYGIAATVGLNNGQGAGACFYYQIGRFGKPGSEYIDAFQVSGVDHLDNRCYRFDASTLEDVRVDFKHKNLLCAIDFEMEVDNPQNCRVFHQWDFGDGTTSNERNPLHSYNAPGTYTVTLNVFYQCGACTGNSLSIKKQIVLDPDENLFVDTLINVRSAIKKEVLSNVASTYSDTWPLQHEVQTQANQSGYLNGSQGVWRMEGTHAYEVDRKQSPTLSLSKDGSYELEQFNWEFAALDAIPNWIKANTMTVYSPYSYELENRNVLGVYNAALYDYGGHFPSANGVNMRNDEMAFTGFEYLTGKASGNWIFGNQPIPRYRWFGTEYNYKHIVVVKASLKELEGFDKVDVFGRNYFYSFFPFFGYRYIRDNEIVCRREHPLTPEWSILVLRRALFEGFWRGYVMLRNELQPIISPDLDNTISHSGEHSLKVTNNKIYEQSLLRLDSGKSYHISAWVSVNNEHLSTPELADGLGVEITFKDQNDVLAGSFMAEPAGKIIEGWQQVTGTFTSPLNNPKMELSFKAGSTGTAWYDDLRLHPAKGNMQSYVYSLTDYRLQAVLDEENFGTFFYYDGEGNLYLTKKETEKGIKTISENVRYVLEH